MRARCRWLWVGAACGCLLGSVGAGASEESPSTDESCINDHAKMIGKGDAASIRSTCKRASREKIEMMVVTVESLDGFHPRPLSLDSFVDGVFDEWDIEYDAKAHAILLFVAKREAQIRIRIGDDYGDKDWDKVVSVMKRTVGPALRRRASAGIRQGFDRLYRELAVPKIRDLKRKQQRNRPSGIVNFE